MGARGRQFFLPIFFRQIIMDQPARPDTSIKLGFREACARMAQYLGDTDFKAQVARGWDQGGLVFERERRNIVQMNRLGMLTYDSQVGQKKRTFYAERAYVLAAMPKGKAAAFVERMSRSDVLCLCPAISTAR